MEAAERWLLNAEAAVTYSTSIRDNAAVALEQSNAALFDWLRETLFWPEVVRAHHRVFVVLASPPRSKSFLEGIGHAGKQFLTSLHLGIHLHLHRNHRVLV